ncbi:GAF domain-containing protein [uncultured Cellulomonas sp.]|uniref:GAF domain-containing protein n=1 Tax=uncultured Cellulomonas sp. TaxID=189682 RepID=UPI0028ED39E3|nr:GAF domain-containing protein [uncultured Cellulomonas sp.]
MNAHGTSFGSRGPAGIPHPDGLRAVVARSSGQLMSDSTVDTLLGLLTSAAQRVVPAASGAGLTLEGPDAETVTLAATHPDVELLDALQYEIGEGPCLTAWRDRVVVRVDDVTVERRWPRWCEEAARTEMRCSLSAPMVVGDTVLGAVKVYGRSPGSVTEDDEATMRVFAAQAAILVAHAQDYRRAGALSDNLQLVLRQRDDINRACGVLMQREGRRPRRPSRSS